MKINFDYIWFYKKYLPERHGQQCRVLARGNGGGPRNVLVEFKDGFKVVGTRFCVRKAKRGLHNDARAKGFVSDT